MSTKKKLKNLLKQNDLFSTDVSFRDPKGSSFSSSFGACLSIAIFVITVLYASKKTITLKERDDTLITAYTERNLLETGSFGYEETGFNLAMKIKLLEGKRSS